MYLLQCCKDISILCLSVGGDGYQEGLASYRLGNAYESVGEHDTAIKVIYAYLLLCYYNFVYYSITRATWNDVNIMVITQAWEMLTRLCLFPLKGKSVQSQLPAMLL